jgi:CheY-like chemotaxis protein
VGTRVLVIEDDEAIAALLVDVLTEEGYIPTVRTTPDAALALLRSEGCGAFHLVLSNPFAESQACPYAFVEHLRALTAAPIVICSAAPPRRYADYHTRGYAGFLAEPFDLTDLIPFSEPWPDWRPSESWRLIGLTLGVRGGDPGVHSGCEPTQRVLLMLLQAAWRFRDCSLHRR